MKFESRRVRPGRAARRFSRNSLRLEPLEDRHLLSATPVYVNDNWQLTTDNAPPGVSNGDGLIGANETLGFPSDPAIVATYGTNGFGSVLQANQTFNSASDAAWTRNSPLAPQGAGATFSFPSSSQGSLGYRILTPASPDPATLGPGRAGSVLGQFYNDFRVSVDIVAWNDTLDQAFGLLARVSNIGAGGTNGYSLSYNNQDHIIAINRVAGEAPTELGQALVTLNPLNDYTLTLTGIGSTLTAQVTLAGSTVPLASVSVVDATYANGQVGVFNFDATTPVANGTADSTFDNFVAYGGVSTINTALAGTTPGGVTNIVDGKYNENVLLNTNVTLAGSGTLNGTLSATGVGAIVSPGIGSGAGQFHTGNVSLGGSSALQIGLIAPVLIDNFNAARAWPVGFATEYGTYESFDGQVTQNGNGTLVIGGTAKEQGGLYRNRGGDVLYNFTGRTQLEATVKTGLGNSADTFIVSLVDLDGTEFYYSFLTSGLNDATFTTLTHDLSKPDSITNPGDDAILDLANIVEFNIRGDHSSNAALQLVFDNLQVGGQDQLDVTGTVNLAGAVLGGTVVGFTPSTPSAGQQFVIINNDGVDPIGSTFAGKVEGSTVTFSNKDFSISYFGGTGNDVVLTALAPAVSLVGKRLFYNNSKFDGNQVAAGAADDAAIATDKSALLPGQAAAFANVSSYSRGINGVMLDIQNLTVAPTVNDFIFRGGNDNTPGSWAAAADPTITVRAGAGASGSSRVTLIWPDGTLKNTWLQVTAKTSLGLSAAEVFYFGNAVGESGSVNSVNFLVNSTDEIGARNNPKTFLNPALVADVYDYNRDGYVNATDQILARSNSTTTNNDLNVIVVPAALMSEGGAAEGLGVRGERRNEFVSIAPAAARSAESTPIATATSSNSAALSTAAVDQICTGLAASLAEQRPSARRALHAAHTLLESRFETVASELLALLANRH